MFEQWKLGAKALAVLRSARELLRTIDFDALTAILLHVIALERELSGPGNGALKLSRLLNWFVSTFPHWAGEVGMLREFASALVGLFNLVQLFRKS